MKLKANLDTDLTFTLLPTEEGAVEVSWVRERYGHVETDPYFRDPASGYLTVLPDGAVCVPFTRDDEYWVCVVTQQGDVSLAKTEDYPPPAESLTSVFPRG